MGVRGPFEEKVEVAEDGGRGDVGESEDIWVGGRERAKEQRRG